MQLKKSREIERLSGFSADLTNSIKGLNLEPLRRLKRCIDTDR
nr:MAG TPA: hypothetical protein [Caudoviricetes sp.]